MEGAPKQYTKEEIAELEKSRTISDADFLNNGAKYDVNMESGEKQLILNDEQIEKEKGDMEKILKEERIDSYFHFLKSNAKILEQNGGTEALSLSMSRISSDRGLVEDAVFDNGVWQVTFKDGKVEEIEHAHRKSELFKSLEEKIPKTTNAIEELLLAEKMCGCLYCSEEYKKESAYRGSGRAGLIEESEGMHENCLIVFAGLEEVPESVRHLLSKQYKNLAPEELDEIKKRSDENLLKSRRWGTFFHAVKDEIGMTPTDFMKEVFVFNDVEKGLDGCTGFGPQGIKYVLVSKFLGLSKEEILSSRSFWGPFL